MLGFFLGIYEGQLRYFSIEGSLMLSPQEAALQERQIAKQAKAELQELQDKMRSLGISID